ncbi:hypothetical protein H8L32_01160 [Undibacterium sp. CY18W]|uniref:Uncharacterized protein n=1 Tax=Undibacterium hunanense TaxID=2762292 RepID=A0ABR6ZJK3_9BURK|nr:hypothetical protein [Undibacterium hunanense]MBC3916081.1 hypothetical protein [Undibacterium hunanense]
MKLSRFFEDLMSVYKAELEDLKSDSEGKNVLKARLREKAEQLPMLLPMMASNPEMLAVAFHEGFIFMNPLALEALSTKEENKLPSWKSLSAAVKLEPWAEPLSRIVLKDPAGEAFLVIAAGLEYLNRSQQTRKLGASDAQDEDDEDREANEASDELKESGDLDGQYGRHGRDDGDDGDDYDLGEAGADWLAEQGFDRKE